MKPISFSQNLNRIENRDFKDCVSLESIYITNKVDFIGFESFSGCFFLKKKQVYHGRWWCNFFDN